MDKILQFMIYNIVQYLYPTVSNQGMDGLNFNHCIYFVDFFGGLILITAYMLYTPSFFSSLCMPYIFALEDPPRTP